MKRKYLHTTAIVAAMLLITTALPLSAATINRIAFVDRAGDLYVIRPDGTDRQKMASGELLQKVSSAPRPVQRGRDFYSWPAWSPDGQLLASFRVEINSGRPTDGLYIFDVGSTRVLHAYKEPGLQPIYAYWSPNRQQLGVLMGNRGSFSLNLWPPSNGQRPKRVAQGSPFYFNWRSDGQAVLAHMGGSPEGESGHAISVVDIPSGEKHLVSRSPSAFGPPSWSFDGKWLAYGNTVEVQGKASLMIAARNGSQPESVALVPERIALEWSPNQPLLAIATTSFVGDPLFEEIRLFDVATGKLQTLIEDNFAAFFWSPDGSRILYAKRHLDREYWTWVVVDIRSGKSIPVVNFIPSHAQILVFRYFDQYALSHRLWSPDSQFFTFSGHVGANLDPAQGFPNPFVYVVPVSENTIPQKLSDGHMAFWSPQ